MPDAPVPRLRQVVLDSTDPRAAAECWRRVLGLEYREGQEPPGPGEDHPDGRDWLNLRTPAGEPRLAFPAGRRAGEDHVAPVIVVSHVVQMGTPKTAKGRRTVTLDDVTVSVLREHRARQNAERLLVGSSWTDLDLVFCRVDGTPLHPERFTRQFSERIRQLGLPKIRLHDLRHGWATMALTAGVHPKVVQERLGHANIGITLDTYSHVTAGLHSDAADKVAGLVFGDR